MSSTTVSRSVAPSSAREMPTMASVAKILHLRLVRWQG